MSTDGVRIAQARGATALAGREVRRVGALWTQTILPSVLTGILFLAVFGGALGGRIDRIGGLDYLTFVLPGVLVMTVASQSFANSSTSFFQAKNEGYLEDVLTSPLTAWQVVGGYLAGGVARGLVATLVLGGLAAPFADVDASALAALGLVLTALAFAALGVVVGLWADTFDQHALIANVIVTPLALLGGVFYSARMLDEPWRTLTRADPLYYLVDAVRGGLAGVHETTAWVALLSAAGTAAVVFVAASVLLGRGWRVKP